MKILRVFMRIMAFFLNLALLGFVVCYFSFVKPWWTGKGVTIDTLFVVSWLLVIITPVVNLAVLLDLKRASVYNSVEKNEQ